MKNFFAVLLALWKLAVWWNKKDEATQAKRKELKGAVDEAIKTNDTRALHRIMSEL